MQHAGGCAQTASSLLKDLTESIWHLAIPTGYATSVGEVRISVRDVH